MKQNDLVLTDYDFLDFGASKGGSIGFAIEHLGGTRGLGIDLDPNKVAVMRELGHRSIALIETNLGGSRTGWPARCRGRRRGP